MLIIKLQNESEEVMRAKRRYKKKIDEKIEKMKMKHGGVHIK